MPGHLEGRSVKYGDKYMTKLGMKAKAAATWAAGRIIYISSVSGGYVTMNTAAAGTPASHRGRLFVSRTAIGTSGNDVDALPMCAVTGLDTSAGAIGDPVYLGAAGAFSLTKSARKVGVITKVDATSGEIFFDGALGASGVVSGIGEVPFGTSTVTIAAATLGGSFGGKPAGACLIEADGTIHVVNVVWSTNDLVINTSANVTAARDVAYWVFTE
jgi:hypothetical protein